LLAIAISSRNVSASMKSQSATKNWNIANCSRGQPQDLRADIFIVNAGFESDLEYRTASLDKSGKSMSESTD
jgi:hypothetical protein